MERYHFKAPECQADGTHIEQSWCYEGSVQHGWKIERNGDPFLEIGPGYECLKGICCGICSTDIAKPFLPYPLPQIIGHECIVLHQDQAAAVEINASHRALGLKSNCPYCHHGLSSHCPERITLGINQLPGGFAPYVLAPKQAIHKIPDHLSPSLASVIEPLAAALQVLKAQPPQANWKVAVLGPRRLGMLVIAAIQSYRTDHQFPFTITALTRRAELHGLAQALGADECFLSHESDDHAFDLVIDTTGSPQGFQEAMRVSRNWIHLKSTHGSKVMGLGKMADCVVDEQSIQPFTDDFHQFKWVVDDERRIQNVLLSPSLPHGFNQDLKQKHPDIAFHVLNTEEALHFLQQLPSTWPSKLPQFDLAITQHSSEIDDVIRPIPNKEFSLIRPKSVIYCLDESKDSLAGCLAQHKLKLISSRCGSFADAVELLSHHTSLSKVLEEQFITHHYPLDKISQAFEIATQNQQSIKVVVQTT